MSKRTLRALAGQFTAAAVGVVATAVVLGGGFAFAQTASEAGVGVAEALAGPNTVNSAAVINGTLGRADVKVGTIPLWARVRADGTIIASKGVTGAALVEPGGYAVDFSRSITACAWVVTATDNDSGVAAAGFVTAERQFESDPDSLLVRTFNPGGSQVTRAVSDGFTVLVTC